MERGEGGGGRRRPHIVALFEVVPRLLPQVSNNCECVWVWVVRLVTVMSCSCSCSYYSSIGGLSECDGSRGR